MILKNYICQLSLLLLLSIVDIFLTNQNLQILCILFLAKILLMENIYNIKLLK